MTRSEAELIAQVIVDAEVLLRASRRELATAGWVMLEALPRGTIEWIELGPVQTEVLKEWARLLDKLTD